MGLQNKIHFKLLVDIEKNKLKKHCSCISVENH